VSVCSCRHPRAAALAVAAPSSSSAFPIWLICCHQPKKARLRPGAWPLAICSSLPLGCTGLIALWTVDLRDSSRQHGCLMSLNLIAYALLIPAFAAAVLFCFDTSAWNALFAVTAGYTIQNLALRAQRRPAALRQSALWHACRATPLGRGWSFTPHS
jgi:hypothetical protein